MHPPLKFLSLVSATVLLSLSSPLPPTVTTPDIARVLAQTPTTQDQKAEADGLFQKGVEQFRRSQFREALQTYQQVLRIRQELGDKVGEGITLNNIGTVYLYQGEYATALEFYQQALVLHKQVGNKAMEGTTLNNLGEVYRNLGEYAIALEFYQQALALHKQVDNKAEEGTTLNNIGTVYLHQGEYATALEFYSQALVLHKQVGNKAMQGTTLNNLGLVYLYQRQYDKALEFYQQALALHKQVGNKAMEGTTLNNLGLVYLYQRQYDKALEFLSQAVAIHKQVGNKEGQGITLGSIGYLLAEQNQPELAIVFYKQSVNVTEAIRQAIRGLPQGEQASYTKTVADTYRQLANLLLKQNRVLEAQQVLDLLKVQEVRGYLGNVPNTNQAAQDVNLLSTEQRVGTQYSAIQDKVIALGQELTALRNIPEANRTPAQQQRITELVKNEETIRQEFNSFMKSPAVVALTQQLRITGAGQNLALENLNKLRSSLRQLQQNAVLLYPLVLEDRLEIVLVTADTPPIHRSVAVKKDDFSKAVVRFRAALQNPSRDAKVSGQQLYEWLIKPIEKDLTQAQAQSLIYAPDGQLRYIPLAALYDGKQWLVQRFRINSITAASLTDLTAKPHISPRVLAAAFTQGTYSVQVGSRQVPLSGLQFAGKEVDNVAAMIPNTTKLLNRQFSRDAIVPRLNDYNIIHFATHAAFVAGQPEDSFILFGNGDRVTLPDVGKWSLPNVDLVVLSACQTALGGQLGNGEEILGLGYQMQQAGAKAAIATLWTVDDGGTQALMDVFYTLLKQSKVSKVEALRQAQIALITGNYKTLGEQQGMGVRERTPANLPTTVTSQLSHPYYWAPFILIGNGL